MKPLTINGTEVWYTEVQVKKTHFWFLTTDPFLTPNVTRYHIFMQKKYTLAKALEYFGVIIGICNATILTSTEDNNNCI